MILTENCSSSADDNLTVADISVIDALYSSSPKNTTNQFYNQTEEEDQ